MDNFLYINAGKSTLSLNITASQQTLKVANPGRFPTSIPAGQVLVLTLHPEGLPSTQEIVHCTAINGSVFSVARGAQGTTPASWPAGTVVGAYLTAFIMSQIFEEIDGHAGSGGSVHALVTQVAAGFMAAADKAKLDGVQAGATNYQHPANHDPSVIAQNASNRFATDQEKANWNAAKNHADSAHAPANAQKNSDITLAEIQEKLASGLTVGGQIAIQGGAPTLHFTDSDNADRAVHCNSGLVGFLNSGGGWSFYSRDDGQNVSVSNLLVGSATLFTNGDLYMPWAGDYLSNIVTNRLVKDQGINAIGSYALCARDVSTAGLDANGYYSGGSLHWAGFHKNDDGGSIYMDGWSGAIGGTWRCCGHYPVGINRMKITLFQRVA